MPYINNPMESRLFIVKFVSIFFKAKKLWVSNSCFFHSLSLGCTANTANKIKHWGVCRFVFLFYMFWFFSFFLPGHLQLPIFPLVFSTDKTPFFWLPSLSVLHVVNIDFPNPVKAKSVTSMMLPAATDLENRRAKVATARHWFPTW